MAKIIYVNFRNTIPNFLEAKLFKICKKLEPDNITANKPKIALDEGIAYAIINPVNSIEIKDNSILMGHMYSREGNWHQPSSKIPDGSFAIYRSDNEYVEIATDSVGSRAVWYYMDQDLFIASSSQRAIVLFLESFEFNEKVIPWMLTNGTLGPNFSWDRRIKRLNPDSSILLTKKTWVLESKKVPLKYNEVKRSFREHKKVLRNSIESTFQNLNLDLKKWVLPLSGGYDSRGILFFMLNGDIKRDTLNTITWGLNVSQKEKGNDAYLAKELAKEVNVNNKYYSTDLTEESIEIVLKRFIEFGEGRIDHLSGYMDGFKIWKTLFENGVQGIIRGDLAYGMKLMDETIIRSFAGCKLYTDFSNPWDYEKYNIPKQEVPDFILKRDNESLNEYGDRLYRQYRIPAVVSALSDLKLGYVEQITPLLSRRINTALLSLPENLRTEKLLIKNIVDEFEPKIKYAKTGATARPNAILKSEKIVALMKEELNSDYAQSIFSKEFLEYVIGSMTIKINSEGRKSNKKILITYLKNMVPWSVKKRLFSIRKRSMDPNLMAFRIFIIIYMHKLLNRMD